MLKDSLILLGAAMELAATTPAPTPPPVVEKASPVLVQAPLPLERRPGTGAPCVVGDRVTIHLEAFDGGTDAELASTRKRGLPFTFVLAQSDFLSGHVLGMRPGGLRSVTLTADLVNGGQGLPPFVPAGRPVRLEISLVSLVRAR